MKRALTIAMIAASLLPAGLTYATFLGLGLHRQAPAWAISAAATILVFGPPLAAAGLAQYHRGRWYASVSAVWAVFLFVALPVYFPGERQSAVITGLSLGGAGGRLEGMARVVASTLPDDPEMAEPEVPEATTLASTVIPQPLALAENQIALPYEGEGRRLAVPVSFTNGDNDLDTVWMMLDTGATYTTLPTSVLADLGIHPDENDPVIHLHTANGERTAQVVLLDKVWLGDLPLEGVAIATCEGCSSSDTAGLLGLNVTSGYNMSIDADRREVIFTSRTELNRHLDVKPFTDVNASVTRFPGGRVEVVVALANQGPRAIGDAAAAIHCGDQSWLVELTDIGPGQTSHGRRRLPPHEPCERYQVGLHSASW